MKIEVPIDDLMNFVEGGIDNVVVNITSFSWWDRGGKPEIEYDLDIQDTFSFETDDYISKDEHNDIISVLKDTIEKLEQANETLTNRHESPPKLRWLGLGK